VIVQLSVTLDPAATPVTVVLNNVLFVRVAEPDVIVQTPVPEVGLFPASVNVETLQFD
jgi:hypothetical protein